jgi:pimeloyl-ACP methyl ester carboxylesterase
VPERYAEVDPVARPPRLPVVVLHGDRDSQVPVELSNRYATAAGAAGADVRLRTLTGVEHFALIDPEHAAWAEVEAELRTQSKRSFTIDAR